MRRRDRAARGDEGDAQDEDEGGDRYKTFGETANISSLSLLGKPLLVRDEETGEMKQMDKFLPVWKQTVTDEQGRRRFHGAFTGGFSAGYFNTVGTKEGWAPSSFVSSRDARASAKQSIEDFMDHEDREGGVEWLVFDVRLLMRFVGAVWYFMLDTLMFSLVCVSL